MLSAHLLGVISTLQSKSAQEKGKQTEGSGESTDLDACTDKLSSCHQAGKDAWLQSIIQMHSQVYKSLSEMGMPISGHESDFVSVQDLANPKIEPADLDLLYRITEKGFDRSLNEEVGRRFARAFGDADEEDDILEDAAEELDPYTEQTEEALPDEHDFPAQQIPVALWLMGESIVLTPPVGSSSDAAV